MTDLILQAKILHFRFWYQQQIGDWMDEWEMRRYLLEYFITSLFLRCLFPLGTAPLEAFHYGPNPIKSILSFCFQSTSFVTFVRKTMARRNLNSLLMLFFKRKRQLFFFKINFLLLSKCICACLPIYIWSGVSSGQRRSPDLLGLNYMQLWGT